MGETAYILIFVLAWVGAGYVHASSTQLLLLAVGIIAAGIRVFLTRTLLIPGCMRDVPARLTHFEFFVLNLPWLLNYWWFISAW